MRWLSEGLKSVGSFSGGTTETLEAQGELCGLRVATMWELRGVNSGIGTFVWDKFPRADWLRLIPC